jgi:hypothetical protein
MAACPVPSPLFSRRMPVCENGLRSTRQHAFAAPTPAWVSPTSLAAKPLSLAGPTGQARAASIKAAIRACQPRLSVAPAVACTVGSVEDLDHPARALGAEQQQRIDR